MKVYRIAGLPFSDELYHHGILGQKWGVRRFQNKDGTLTEEGRRREMYRRRAKNAYKTKDKVDDIIKSWSDKDREQFALSKNEEYLTLEQGSAIVKRVLLSDKKNTPVAFFDLLEDNNNELQVALGTRSGDEYRGRGYAKEATKKGMQWYEKNKERLGYDKVVWAPMVDNKASRRLAEENGFILDPNGYSKDRKWVKYERK